MPSKKKSDTNESDERILQLAQQVEQLAQALENAESRLKEMGIADSVTGLYSYRYFLGRATEEVARADRFNHEVSCMMIGLDRTGMDPILIVSKLLKDQCRVYDIPARWSQNELVVLLPATDIDGALTFAERLRLNVESTCVNDAENAGLTVSIGVACYPTKGVQDAASLVEEVHTACFKASKAGGNRTVVRN